MTREEAITVLKAFMEDPLFSDEHKQAFNIAMHDIKARHDWDISNLILINKDNYEPLEQYLCEDAVSRKDVHDMLENLPVTVENHWYNWLQKACIRLAELPPVTPQPKTGRWIINAEGIITTLYRCSECNRTVIDDTGYSPYKDYPFCHCGAKMIESEDKE